MSVNRSNGSRTVGDTNENVIYAGPCYLFGIFPELITIGTVTIRDNATAVGGTPKHVCAIGMPQAGKSFGDFRGVFFANGITVQLSVGTDLCMITWRPT
jgi:hypothetical protein